MLMLYPQAEPQHKPGEYEVSWINIDALDRERNTVASLRQITAWNPIQPGDQFFVQSFPGTKLDLYSRPEVILPITHLYTNIS